MKAARALCLAGVLIGAAACAQASGGDAAPAAGNPPSFAEVGSIPASDKSVSKPALDALEKPIGKFVLDNVPFDQALEQWMKAAHINATIDWKAIEAAGLARRTLISIQLTDVPARRVLALLLEAADQDARLHFIVADNMAVISTRDVLNSPKYQEVSVYDIRPLFADVEYDSQEGAQIVNDFATTLKTMVAPDTWVDNGGSIGRIRFLNGQLYVNQTLDVQDQVAAFIAQSRAAVASTTHAYDVRDLVKEDTQPAADGMPPNRMNALITTIQINCGRDTWRGNGGKTSSIAAFDGKLYVTTNPVVHQQIGQLLAMMRKKD